MSIKAEYIQTCLPDYVQDGHNRPGEMLVSSPLGIALCHVVDAMLESMDMEAYLPHGWTNDAVGKAIEECLAGVDLRAFDADGNRVDELDEDYDDENQAYVLLTWDATVTKIHLDVDIDYQANGVEPHDLRDFVMRSIKQAFSDGIFREGTESAVIDWGATVSIKE